MKKLAQIFLSFFIIAMTGHAHAGEDVATPETAKALVEKVVKLYKEDGHGKIVEMINAQDSEFRNKDLYAFIMDMEGNMIAHAFKKALVGKNLIKLKDPGNQYLVQNMVKTAQSAEKKGWVDYLWMHPKDNKIKPKTTYVMKLNDKYFAAAGAYKK